MFKKILLFTFFMSPLFQSVAGELTIEYLNSNSRYIKIPAGMGTNWSFNKDGLKVQITRDNITPDLYTIRLSQYVKNSLAEANNQLLIKPGETVIMSGISDDKNGTTLYLVGVTQEENTN